MSQYNTKPVVERQMVDIRVGGGESDEKLRKNPLERWELQ